MQARVKATGEIVDVEPEPYIANDRWDIGVRFTDNDDNIHREYQLDFEDLTQGKADVKEKSLPKDEPDYWEKLKHQYAGMAMQGLLNNNNLLTTLCKGNKEVPICKIVLDNADIIATALVNRLKEKEK